MTASFRSLICNITIIQCYATTEKADAFYQLLNETLKEVKRRNIKIMMGDMNAQIGPENEGLEHVFGRHGRHTRNVIKLHGVSRPQNRKSNRPHRNRWKI
jgi:hypothetical protein